MKKLILSVTAMAACSVGAYAQGTITFDLHSATAPAGTVSINGVLDTTIDINAELLSSATQGGTYAPVAELLLSSSNTSPDGSIGFDSSDILSAAKDITFLGTGKLQDQSGAAFALNAAAGTTLWFKVEGWTGVGATFANAAASGVTAPFSEVLTSSTSIPQANLGGSPALNLTTTVVPEPSTLAMAGVGLASMLIFRRRNK
jgi:hypothetical protein